MCSYAPNKRGVPLKAGLGTIDITATSAGENGKKQNQDKWIPCIPESEGPTNNTHNDTFSIPLSTKKELLLICRSAVRLAASLLADGISCCIRLMAGAERLTASECQSAAHSIELHIFSFVMICRT